MGKAPPIEVFPLAFYLVEEMIERGWTATDVAERMGGEWDHDIIVINLILAVQADSMIIDSDLILQLSKAFGLSPQFFKKLHSQWVDNKEIRAAWGCPESVLDGLLIPTNDNSHDEAKS